MCDAVRGSSDRLFSPGWFHAHRVGRLKIEKFGWRVVLRVAGSVECASLGHDIMIEFASDISELSRWRTSGWLQERGFRGFDCFQWRMTQHAQALKRGTTRKRAVPLGERRTTERHCLATAILSEWGLGTTKSQGGDFLAVASSSEINSRSGTHSPTSTQLNVDDDTTTRARMR